jgi:hypothetical protein
MHLNGRVRPALAVVFFAALAACGGGGGGGAVPGGGGGGGGLPTPTPVPTATPPAPGYVAPTGGVTQLGPTASNQFASSMLNASADGTFVVQSTDTPAEAAAGTSLTEYDVTATETAGGQVPGARTRVTANLPVAANQRAPMSVERAFVPPYRPRFDPRTTALNRRYASFARSRTVLGRRTESARTAQSFSVGSTRVFHVLQAAITGVGGTCNPPKQSQGGQCYIDVPATVRAVSNHAYVWVEDAVYNDASYNFSSSDWTTAANTFDTDYARETAAFGPAFFQANFHYPQCNTSGTKLPNSSFQPTVDLSGSDPHISFLITNVLAANGEGGYFDFGNDLNDQELNCAYNGPHAPSNQLPMFIIGADKYNTGSSTVADEGFWRTLDMPRSIPHEFQHYLHAMNKVLIPELGSNVQGYFDDSVVDEGCSELAEDLVLGSGVNSPQSWEPRYDAWTYLLQSGNFSIPSFTGYDADPLSTSPTPSYGFFHNTQGSYGGAYLLARYMYDRFGGDAAMHRLYADLSPSSSSVANLHPIVAEAGNGESFAQLYDEFAAALAARGVASTDSRFTFGSNVLLSGLTTITFPGGTTYNLRFNGPRSPEDLTSSTPGSAPRIKLTPGNSVHAKLISGATLFFNTAASGGSLVELNSTSAAGGSVVGGLVQGGYNDNSACLGSPTTSPPCT